MRIFLDNKNKSISNIVATCCERAGCDLVGDYSYDLLIKDCDTTEDISETDREKTLFLLSKDIYDKTDVENKILKPFLPTELIAFLKEFSAKFIKKEPFIGKNSDEIDQISNIVKEIDSMYSELEEGEENGFLEADIDKFLDEEYTDEESLLDEFNSEDEILDMSEENFELDDGSPLEDLAANMSEDEITRILKLGQNNTFAEHADAVLRQMETENMLEEVNSETKFETGKEYDKCLVDNEVILGIKEPCVSEFAEIYSNLEPIKLVNLDEFDIKKDKEQDECIALEGKFESNLECETECKNSEPEFLGIKESINIEDNYKESLNEPILESNRRDECRTSLENALEKEIVKSIEQAVNSGRLKKILKDMKMKISISFEDRE